MATMRARTKSKDWDDLHTKRKAGGFAGDLAADCRAEKRIALPAFLGNPALAERIDLSDCDLTNEQSAAQDRWWDALFGSLGTWDLRPELTRLRVPRLVVAGGRDFIPMEGSREWVVGMPEARLLVLPDAGHFPQIEAPEGLFRALNTFLAGRWPEDATALQTEKR
jgi:pimeloyl-ACP methyl ester carboxylesterase